MLKNNIGIMQGRLLPKYRDQYQAHPVGNWQEEFFIARDLELDCIEFIFDYHLFQQNPLFTANGINSIAKIVERSQIEVESICADFFMECPLHSNKADFSSQSRWVLKRLLDNAKNLGVKNVVLPCVDQSSIQDSDSLERLVAVLKTFQDQLENLDINLALETDLDPIQFKNLLSRFDSARITVNYDIGNSASLGYDPVHELSVYGQQITDIHIKDRPLSGFSVMLGRGNAQFDKFLFKLKDFDYHGPFIMQAYRDENGVKVFEEQLDYFKNMVSNYYV